MDGRRIRIAEMPIRFRLVRSRENQQKNIVLTAFNRIHHGTSEQISQTYQYFIDFYSNLIITWRDFVKYSYANEPLLIPGKTRLNL